jgi:lysozyme family protein
LTDVAAVINGVIDREGGYVNHPEDRGGETNFGITASTALAFGYKGRMDMLPRVVAFEIYKKLFWVQPWFDKVDAIESLLGDKLLDYGVNCGTMAASLALQRCLSALNRQGQDFADLLPDGRIGSITIGALQAFLNLRGADGVKVLLFMIAAQQSNYYLTLAEKDASQETFEYGWQFQRALYKAVP